ncbi:hypothetical protein scyTo_0009239, partial [Scyliorhinus torazame]|nr:hypothetical protein [Scyliorhinus torazame]
LRSEASGRESEVDVFNIPEPSALVVLEPRERNKFDFPQLVLHPPSNMSESNVKVAVRIRPLNRREIDLNTKCVIDVEGNQTILNPANANLGKGDASKENISRSCCKLREIPPKLKKGTNTERFFKEIKQNQEKS